MADAKLVLVILAVEQVPRSVEFYTQTFGWPRAVDTESYVELALPQGMRLGLYDRAGFAKNTGEAPAPPPTSTTTSELYLYVDDLGSAIDRAVRAGARILNPSSKRDWGDEVAYVADPDGNVVALARPLS